VNVVVEERGVSTDASSQMEAVFLAAIPAR
jgi:hypothetical protein